MRSAEGKHIGALGAERGRAESRLRLKDQPETEGKRPGHGPSPQRDSVGMGCVSFVPTQACGLIRSAMPPFPTRCSIVRGPRERGAADGEAAPFDPSRFRSMKDVSEKARFQVMEDRLIKTDPQGVMER